jgi:hypothetical protein
LEDEQAENEAPATANRLSVWQRIPGWLGVGAALLGLVTYALPWYTVSGGASYSGIRLLFTASIPYVTPARAPQGGDCYGALSGYNLPVALLVGVLLASLAGSVAMRWLLPRRRAAFALTLALLAVSWLGESFPYSWASATLPTAPIGGMWSCAPAGSQDTAFTVFLHAK